jgi:hypothetical protein
MGAKWEKYSGMYGEIKQVGWLGWLRWLGWACEWWLVGWLVANCWPPATAGTLT